jgi:hypothetical protein
MTDELTPEEQEALKNLPRERMPVGLEGRVVEAMRARGFLARRRRTFAITGGRAAGLVAACVALMIGAYSLGLHRGGDDAVPPRLATVPSDDERAALEPRRALTESPADEVGRTESPKVADAGQMDLPESPAVADAQKKGAPEPREEKAAAPAGPAVRTNETVADRAEKTESPEEALAAAERETAGLLPPQKASAPASARPESVGRVRFAQSDAVLGVARKPLTFVLDGSVLTVEADSARVTRDERGRMLLIYTPDGVIRVRLTGE